MGERVLRGSRLGTTSYETDRNTDLAPRQDVIYDCPRGHTVAVPMSSDAELPPTWECKVSRAASLAATLLRDREQARLFRQLALLRTDVPVFESVDELEWKGPTPALPALRKRLETA